MLALNSAPRQFCCSTPALIGKLLQLNGNLVINDTTVNMYMYNYMTLEENVQIVGCFFLSQTSAVDRFLYRYDLFGYSSLFVLVVLFSFVNRESIPHNFSLRETRLYTLKCTEANIIVMNPSQDFR